MILTPFVRPRVLFSIATLVVMSASYELWRSGVPRGVFGPLMVFIDLVPLASMWRRETFRVACRLIGGINLALGLLGFFAGGFAYLPAAILFVVAATDRVSRSVAPSRTRLKQPEVPVPKDK